MKVRNGFSAGNHESQSLEPRRINAFGLSWPDGQRLISTKELGNWEKLWSGGRAERRKEGAQDAHRYLITNFEEIPSAGPLSPQSRGDGTGDHNARTIRLF
jgi:hypothetical protein